MKGQTVETTVCMRLDWTSTSTSVRAANFHAHALKWCASSRVRNTSSKFSQCVGIAGGNPRMVRNMSLTRVTYATDFTEIKAIEPARREQGSVDLRVEDLNNGSFEGDRRGLRFQEMGTKKRRKIFVSVSSEWQSGLGILKPVRKSWLWVFRPCARRWSFRYLWRGTPPCVCLRGCWTSWLTSSRLESGCHLAVRQPHHERSALPRRCQSETLQPGHGASHRSAIANSLTPA